MKKVRIGIIGIGNMGSAHAMSIYQNKVEGMELSAVCDLDEERLAWAEDSFGHHVKRYISYQEMLKDPILDAVLIATPHKSHPIIAEDAFRSSIHVLTEKPAGVDTLSVRKMNEAAKVSGKKFGIMYNQRTNELFAALKKYVADGTLGELKRVVWIVNNWYRTQAYYDSGAWRATWNGEGGGVLLNQCPHNLDIWQWITGMPVKIRAFCTNGKYHNISVEDDVTIYGEYENGATAVFITSTGEYPGTNRLEISGTGGKAVLENGVLKIYTLKRDERDICMNSKDGMPVEEVFVEEIKQENPETGHIGILQNFANAILQGEELLAPGEEGIHGLTLSNAAYLSSWLDEWVSIPMDEERFLELLKIKQEEEEKIDRKVVRENIKGEYINRWSVQWGEV